MLLQHIQPKELIKGKIEHTIFIAQSVTGIFQLLQFEDL